MSNCPASGGNQFIRPPIKFRSTLSAGPFLGGAEVQLEIQSGAAASLFVLLSLDSRLDSGVTLSLKSRREEAKKADLL